MQSCCSSSVARAGREVSREPMSRPCRHPVHHEIYLSDARRVAPEKRRTILRQPVLRG
ncbi:hypothetical protein MICRO8M_80060 [Microbacterium sp. 8M]|nr:hypothetical protein MICRO8M_80060 [Microbacterium sp. 8M]